MTTETETSTDTSTEQKDRRYFPRVPYRAYASLTTTSKRWSVHILDLSFNGALVGLIGKHKLTTGEEVILKIRLEDDSVIRMQGKLAHHKDHLLGIECRAGGIDHQAHLHSLLNQHKDRDFHRSLVAMLRAYEDDDLP